MTELPTKHSCYDCEWHTNDGSIHVCSEGIQATAELLDEETNDCHKWAALDVERRAKKNAEIAAQVKPPEPKLSERNWREIEQAVMADMAQNPEQWRRGYLSGYPSREEDERIRKMHRHIPYPRGREAMDRQRFSPTLEELHRVQERLPDPNMYSEDSIRMELLIDVPGQYLRTIPLQFSKVDVYDYRNRSFSRWVYHGHVMMDDQRNPDIEDEYLRHREQQARRAYEVWANANLSGNTNSQPEMVEEQREETREFTMDGLQQTYRELNNIQSPTDLLE